MILCFLSCLMISSKTRMVVTSPIGKYESSPSSNCHKNVINKDFATLFLGLDQVFVQDKIRLMWGLNVKSYFWPIRLSLPTVPQLSGGALI